MTMSAGPALDEQTLEHVSAAARAENVASLGSREELSRIVAAGPRGALALAGLAVAVLVAIWLAFFLLVYLPRGPVA